MHVRMCGGMGGCGAARMQQRAASLVRRLRVRRAESVLGTLEHSQHRGWQWMMVHWYEGCVTHHVCGGGSAWEGLHAVGSRQSGEASQQALRSVRQTPEQNKRFRVRRCY